MSINLCACIGPVKGEPLCPCAMVREYGKTTAWDKTPEEEAAFEAALKRIIRRPDENIVK